MTIVFVSTACELKLKQFGEDSQTTLIEIQRYDRLESRYLTTGDFSALQQMNIEYPMETRTLIEDVLQLGEVNDPGMVGNIKKVLMLSLFISLFLVGCSSNNEEYVLEATKVVEIGVDIPEGIYKIEHLNKDNNDNEKPNATIEDENGNINTTTFTLMDSSEVNLKKDTILTIDEDIKLIKIK